MVIFDKKWKKYNKIQLTKNKMDLNIRKMTNHPPSPAQQHRIPHRKKTRHNDTKPRHSSARNKTTIFGRGEVGVIDKFSK